MRIDGSSQTRAIRVSLDARRHFDLPGNTHAALTLKVTHMAPPQILVVGTEPAAVHSVNSLLAGNSYESETVAFGAPAVTRIYRDPTPDLVLLELTNGHEGLQTLQQFLHLRPDLKVIVMSKVGDSRQVVEAIRIGAQDYITVPFRECELLQLLKRHVKHEWEADSPTKESVEDVGGGHFFTCASPLMQKVRLQAELLANIDVPVLILGESGTGKEAAAHLIHKLSARSDRRLLKVNCAALPGELLESELFGYERGAFTGATRTKAGKFELCDKGTILLDEVAEMPGNLQAKLLHVLQDKQFSHLGGEATIEVDVRILAATNVNVQQAIAERRFREDLYYRLCAFTIILPPLRDRQDEIPVLLGEFMQRIDERMPALCLAGQPPGITKLRQEIFSNG
jgi:DNA-binding NtrC family response regulator